MILTLTLPLMPQLFRVPSDTVPNLVVPHPPPKVIGVGTMVQEVQEVHGLLQIMSGQWDGAYCEIPENFHYYHDSV